MIARSRFATLGAGILLLFWTNASVFAHAELRRAIPAAAGSVSTAPAEVLVNFNEPLEGALSSVVVRDAVGKRVDKADAHLDPGDRTTMRISLQPLKEGTYIVVWRAVTADTHRVEGAFIFRIRGSQ